MKLSPLIIFFFWMLLMSAQHQDGVDFKHCSADIYVQPMDRSISGKYQTEFQLLKNIDSIFLDAHNMSFDKIKITKHHTHKNPGVRFTPTITGDKLIIHARFQKDQYYTLSFEYDAKPKQTVYFLGWNDDNPNNDQIWTQGQGKYTSHWLPSFDDMNEKVEFDLSFIVKEDHEVISNGELISKEQLPESGFYRWKFDMEKPMSSYLLAFTMGNFKKETLNSNSGIPMGLFYEPKDSLSVEPTYRYSKRIFDFLEAEIGVPYPWKNYKQIPVQDFLYAGMENTGATIFSNTFVVDSTAFFDKNYVNVNAHELAHQWFGNMVTEQSGAHHWLHEGFATFYAYLTEKDIFGEEYYYWHFLETAEALSNFSNEGHGEALTNSNAGSLTFYEKGAWALAMLREKVGEENFRTGIRNYLTQYAYGNATIPDFMWEMEIASGINLDDFEENWLQSPDFSMDEVKSFLRSKSEAIDMYFRLKEEVAENPISADRILESAWPNLKSDLLKHRLVLNYGAKFSEHFLTEILEEEGPKVRQAVTIAMNKTPMGLKEQVETLLTDPSYVTIESALYRLWTDFPENRTTYLNKTIDIQGLPNKNIRLLWLTLALVTPDYNETKKPLYFNELSGYTSSEHHFETRLLAFQYLKKIGAFNDAALRNLIAACSHHVWHFKKSSRKILKEFLKTKDNVARVEALYTSLGSREKEYLDKTLGK